MRHMQERGKSVQKSVSMMKYYDIIGKSDAARVNVSCVNGKNTCDVMNKSVSSMLNNVCVMQKSMRAIPPCVRAVLSPVTTVRSRAHFTPFFASITVDGVSPSPFGLLLRSYLPHRSPSRSGRSIRPTGSFLIS